MTNDDAGLNEKFVEACFKCGWWSMGGGPHNTCSRKPIKLYPASTNDDSISRRDALAAVRNVETIAGKFTSSATKNLISAAIAALPATQPALAERTECVKCGHRAVLNGRCEVGMESKGKDAYGYNIKCGCECDFTPQLASEGARKAAEEITNELIAFAPELKRLSGTISSLAFDSISRHVSPTAEAMKEVAWECPKCKWRKVQSVACEQCHAWMQQVEVK